MSRVVRIERNGDIEVDTIHTIDGSCGPCLLQSHVASSAATPCPQYRAKPYSFHPSGYACHPTYRGWDPRACEWIPAEPPLGTGV